jgi:hypothetical protein
MARLYKGVGLGTFLYTANVHAYGITAHMPGLPHSADAVMAHIARATTTSPYISLTRSYGVARDYALTAGRTGVIPTPSNPAFVYEIDLSDPPPAGMMVIDPVAYVAARQINPLGSPSYHHDGNMKFLLGVVDPGMTAHLMALIHAPPGSAPTPRPANLSLPLETFVRALRDAGVLILHAIPSTHVLFCHPVYP